MKTAYIYPYARMSANPYLDDFTASLSNHINFINISNPSKTGILNLYAYLNKIDIVFFNWIEDLPDKRGGLLQVIFFMILVFLMKRKRITIFYTLHNKESHYNTYRLLKKFLRKIILKNADLILCHSSEGINILNNEPLVKGKTLYIPHPFRKNALPPAVKEKKYDILIWGAIRPYKGIDTYLQYLESKNIIHKYRTLIVGKIFPEEYEKELIKYRSDTVQIVNDFVEDSTLNELIGQSHIVLFTYNENSVLSSGALIHSLSRGANVIGPNTGAFKDVYRKDLINVFENYDELIEKINSQLNSTFNKSEKISNYIEENSWENFGMKIAGWISENE
ncbi:MAG: glycosyltransferase [Bacteroidales bacterium]|nr:glycosyltransferase [Bacteroidales bacterium]